MKFEGIDNQLVELQITNYQFPTEISDDWDKNWLNIYLNVKSKVGNWHTVDPSLTTWEIQELIDWFYVLSKNESPQYENLSFTEPNLSFELLEITEDSLTKFRIKFNLESRPVSATEDKDYFVDFLVDNQELKRIGDELKIELEKYPER